MERAKLGLALAGGGFRASLFHLGVLRRMAELDLLRYVEALSTVSGGSIVGALYTLLLKLHLEAPERKGLGPEALRLPQGEYVEIITTLQKMLVAAVQQNLRTRLFMNPLVLLKVMLGEDTLGTAMARLYEKHLFADVVSQLRKQGWMDEADRRAGCISVTALRLRPDEVSAAGGSEQYNHLAMQQPLDEKRGGPGSAVTRLILNATSLNSGARFWFSHAEIGDWCLGHVRYGEIETELLPRKVLLELKPDELASLITTRDPAAAMGLWRDVASRVTDAWTGRRTGSTCREIGLPSAETRWLARWWRDQQGMEPSDPAQPLPWNPLADLAGFDLHRFALRLAAADPGRLRYAKNHAWYLCEGRNRKPPVTAGMDEDTLWMRFWDALKAIDETGTTVLERRHQAHLGSGAGGGWQEGLLRLVVEVYNLSVAQAVSPNVCGEWNRLPLSHAVAASAAFPPVFPPLQLYDLFDDLHVQIVGLTDGGVFDNLGTTALVDEQCNYIIASDPGGIFDARQRTTTVGRLAMTRRLAAILSEQPVKLYRHELDERRRMGHAFEPWTGLPDSAARFAATRALRGLVSFRIDSERLSSQPRLGIEGAAVAGIRTDLDAFGDIEIKALVNEGYILADQYVRAHLAGSPFDPATRSGAQAAWTPATEPALPMPQDARRTGRVIEAGRSRFLRALRLRAPVPVATVLAAVSVLAGVVWVQDWSWSHLYAGGTWLVSRLAATLMDTSLSWISPLLQCIPLKWVVLGAALCITMWIFGWNTWTKPMRRLRERSSHTWVRKASTLGKKLRTHQGWLLWLLFVPLLVFAVSLLACAGHYLFARPFLRATRDPVGLHDRDDGFRRLGSAVAD